MSNLTSTTPFLNSWKSTTLAQAKLLDIKVDYTKEINFKEIHEKLELIKEEKYFEKAKLYNIELDDNQLCKLTGEHMFDAVNSWEKALKEALPLGINWKMNNYDPQGLELAMWEEENENGADSYRKQVDAYYYSTRGC